MKWFKLSQPRTQILSYTHDGILNVSIDGNRYTYRYESPKTIKTLEFYLKNKWFGKSLQLLNGLELVSKG